MWTEQTHESMDLSNGVHRAGIAVALGEIEMPTDADVMHDRSIYSAVASCSSGVELDQAQVVVVGNAPGVGGRYRIGHSVMEDALDARRHLGRRSAPPASTCPNDRTPRTSAAAWSTSSSSARSPGRQVRGRRNAMLDDSDVHWHRQIKACVGGVTAAVTGDPAVFVSVSAAHQGPDGAARSPPSSTSADRPGRRSR